MKEQAMRERRGRGERKKDQAVYRRRLRCKILQKKDQAMRGD